MLKKENRLKKNKHFNYIYKNGDYAKAGCVSLCYIKTKVKPFKVGFSVSNKIGKSVVRSKVKRRMSEIVKALIPLIDRRYNYIFVAREGIQAKNFDEIKDDIIFVIKKAGLFNENNN